MQAKSTGRLGCVLGIAALTAVSTPSRAAWEAVPSVGLSTEVDDNARIVVTEQPSSTRAAVDASVRLRRFTERGQAFIEPRVVADSYLDARDEELENTDVFLVTRFEREFENSRFGFRSDFRRESILRSEIGDALLGDPELGQDPIDTGSGTAGTFTDERERFDLAFDYELSLSNRTNLLIETRRIDVAYIENQSLTRSDFDDTRFAIGLARLVDQRNRVSATVYTSQFAAVRNDNRTDTFGVEGAFERPISEIWTFELTIGVARNEFSFLDADGLPVMAASNDFTSGFSFNGSSEATTWTIGAGRAIAPNSDGFLSLRDDLRAQVRHSLSPRLSLSAGLRAAQISRAAATGESDRDYSRITFAVEWLVTPRWVFNSGVDRVTQEFVGLEETAASNSVFVGMRFEGRSRQ